MTEEEIVAAEMHWLHVNLTIAQEELGAAAKAMVEDAMHRAVRAAREAAPTAEMIRERVLSEVADTMTMEDETEHPFEGLDETVAYLREKAARYGRGEL